MYPLPKSLFITSILSIVILSACSRDDQHTAQGYVEGRYTYIAAPVSGRLTQLLVARGSNVQQGQALFTLEAQPESDSEQAAKDSLAQAQAARDAVVAKLGFANKTVSRYQALVAKKAIDQSQLDEAIANRDALTAELAEREAAISEQSATLKKASWQLTQKNMAAPISGLVFDTYYQQGEYTQAGQAILSLLGPSDIKAIFYVDEPHLKSVKLGHSVHVSCDRCNETIQGTIRFISPTAEYTPPVIYSRDTNSKLIFRVEAGFSDVDAKKLHPGQPIEVTYGVDRA